MRPLNDWLKNLFSGFLASRHTRRHFRRAALLDALNAKTERSAFAASGPMRQIASDDVAGALLRLAAQENGLTDTEVARRRAQY